MPYPGSVPFVRSTTAVPPAPPGYAGAPGTGVTDPPAEPADPPVAPAWAVSLAEAARAALDAHLASDGPVGTGGRQTGHRGWMRAVTAAVVVSLVGRDRPGEVEAASRWLRQLELLQAPSGLFSSGDNLASPPDSAFTITDAGLVLALLRRAGSTGHETGGMPDDPVPDGGSHGALIPRLEAMLAKALPALTTGGVHTPNHRWELAGALARTGTLLGGDAGRAALARARDWLGEGVDVDADGLYSERSANYAAHVTNPSLLLLADVLDRPDLRGVVHTNLHAILDLTTPAGLTETVLSRRQDQKLAGYGLGEFLALFARFAGGGGADGRADGGEGGCARCLAATAWSVRLPRVDAVGVLAHALFDGAIAAGLDLAVGPSGEEHDDDAGSAVPRALGAGERLFAGPRLWRQWDGADWTLAYAGSDVPAAGRVASGLACRPTFLRFARGGVEVASVRLSRDFFGLGPLRPTSLSVAARDAELGGGAVERVIELREEVAASYYQPLTAADRRVGGDYALEFEGRFAASMAFSQRARETLTLRTRVRIAVGPSQVALEVTTDGPAARHALEIAFAGEVVLDGGASLGGSLGGGAHRMLGGAVRVGGEVGPGLVIEASPGSDDTVPAEYAPGEAYEFLGGTDAVGGQRLYVTWSSPGTQRVSLREQPASTGGV